MPRKKIKHSESRAIIAIDWKKVETYILAKCTTEGIAAALGVCRDTIENRCRSEKGVSFSEYRASKKGGGESNIAARQYIAAMQGNTQMLKLLGEEWLDQGKKEFAPPNDAQMDQSLADIKVIGVLLEQNKKLMEEINALKQQTNSQLQSSEQTV